MSGWSARPFSNASRTKSPSKSSSRGSYRRHTPATSATTPTTPTTPESDIQQAVKDNEPTDADVSQAIETTAAEVAFSSGFCSKEELRKAVKKRLKKMDVGKDQMTSAVERAMDSISYKAKRVTSQLQRDRIFNTLTKLTLKQYEGLSQANRDLSGGLDDLSSSLVTGPEEVELAKPTGKRYKRAEFQAECGKLDGLRAESERVCLQLRELGDMMEQCVFDLERNIHQQTLYLSLP